MAWVMGDDGLGPPCFSVSAVFRSTKESHRYKKTEFCGKNHKMTAVAAVSPGQECRDGLGDG